MKQAQVVETFRKICSNRYTCRSFDASKSISDDVLSSIVTMTQSAPSGFNLQPYKIILVSSEEGKHVLSKAMLGTNGQKVLESSLTAIFAADIDPVQNTRKLMDLELANGTDAGYVSSLPSKISFLLGKGAVASTLKATITHLLSPIQASPNIKPSYTNSAVGWSYKNTALAASTYMLAATAHGLTTAPMEGFDERRLCSALDIDQERYSIPLVISTGYALQQGSHSEEFPPKVRFPMEDIVEYR